MNVSDSMCDGVKGRRDRLSPSPFFARLVRNISQAQDGDASGFTRHHQVALLTNGHWNKRYGEHLPSQLKEMQGVSSCYAPQVC
jgi:hypothetical protein